MEVHEIQYCDRCKKETDHLITEDILSVFTHCTECNETVENVKNFF